MTSAEAKFYAAIRDAFERLSDEPTITPTSLANEFLRGENFDADEHPLIREAIIGICGDILRTWFGTPDNPRFKPGSPPGPGEVAPK